MPSTRYFEKKTTRNVHQVLYTSALCFTVMQRYDFLISLFHAKHWIQVTFGEKSHFGGLGSDSIVDPLMEKKQWMKRNTLKEKQELQKANVSFQKHAVPTAFIIKHFNIYNYFKLSSSRTIPGQIQRQPQIHAWLTLFKIVYSVKCV